MAVRTVAQWKTLFDTEWNGSNGMTKAMDYANSGGYAQEYYYIAWHVNAILNAWYATGDSAYLEDSAQIILTMIANDRNVTVGGSTYRGWTNTSLGGVYATEGVPLYESYTWRYVCTWLRVMKDSPTIRGTAHGLSGGVWSGTTTWGDVYDDVLAWTQVNIWDKWYGSDASHTDLYRQNVWMASHWARIGYELYLIDNDPEKLEVAENITFSGFPSTGYSLAGNLRTNSANASGYDMYSSTIDGTGQSDTSHLADVVSWMVLAYDLGFYGSSSDMAKWVVTMDDVIWVTNSPQLIWTGLSNGGSNSSNPTNNFQSSFSDFMVVSKYDTTLQERMDTYYVSSALNSGKKAMNMGQGLYNRAYMNNELVYPETVGSPDTTLPSITSNTSEGEETTRFKRRWNLDEPSKGSIVYDTVSQPSEPYSYTYETTREETYRSTHGQWVGSNNAPALSPGTTYYYRFYIEDAAGNIGYSDEYSHTTLAGSIPVITLTGDSEIFLNVGDTYTELGATWVDAEDGSGNAIVGGDTVNTSVAGTYIVNYNYTDTNSNIAEEKFRTVYVLGTSPIFFKPKKIIIDGKNLSFFYINNDKLKF